MDAKPLRPLRPYRPRTDENVGPNDAPDKTLHQRYKSTGNLPTMVTVGGLRAAAKRTAFGDVTNTTRTSNASKDDSVLNGKNTLLGGSKASFAPLEKKSISLLRPAQRPLSVAGIKGFLSKENLTSTSTTKVIKANGPSVVTQPTTTATNAPLVHKEAPPAHQLPVPQVVSRKNVVKRTTIFQDPAITDENFAPIPPVHQNLIPQPQTTAPIPPVHQTLAPRHHKSQPYLRAEQPVLRRTQSKYILSPPEEDEDKENSFAHLSILSSDVVQPEPKKKLEEDHFEIGPYEPHQQYTRAEPSTEQVPTFHYPEADGLTPALEDVQAYDFPIVEDFAPAVEDFQSRLPLETEPIDEAPKSFQPLDLHKPEVDLSEREHHHRMLQNLLIESDRRAEEDLKAKADAANDLLAVAELTEAEEYWDDELDDEIYEDDGYTTARSCYSRGDNTTGGATTVLIPKMTNKVRKEIALAKEIVESTRTVEEVLDESFDSTMVTEYGDEIFQYMRDLEVKMLPDAHYMDMQGEIQWSMRSVLMEWIMQVHHRFQLLPETLFLCVNYIDRFLSIKIVSLGKLQLVGATAMFIAAKYEEINCPSINEIAYMVDGGYTVDEILKAERFMLSMLEFELGWPGPMSFLRRVSKADDYDVEIRTLAKYFLEVAIMDERFVACPPSYLAAAADCLARMMLKKGDWTPAHVYYSNHTYAQLRLPMNMLLECCDNPQDHHLVVYEKYADRRYQRASLYAESQLQKGFRIPEFGGSGPLSRVSLNTSTATHDLYHQQLKQALPLGQHR